MYDNKKQLVLLCGTACGCVGPGTSTPDHSTGRDELLSAMGLTLMIDETRSVRCMESAP